MPSHALNKLIEKDIFKGLFETPCMTALCFGCITALALPPMGILPVLLISITYLHLLLSRKKTTPLKALLIGWSFGTGYFMIGQYWTTVAFINLFQEHLWLMPISLFLVPTALGALWGLATFITHTLKTNPFTQAILLAITISIAEYLRAQDYVYNYPWNLFGYTAYRASGFLQFSSVIGIHGLGFLTFLAASIPYIWLASEPTKTTKRILFITFLFILSISIWGTIRWNTETKFDENIQISVLQPNLPQEQKDNNDFRNQNLSEILSLIEGGKKNSTDKKTIYVLPETLFTIHHNETPSLYKELGSAIGQNNLAVIGIRRLASGKNDGIDIKNSQLLLNDNGDILSSYNKTRLTPWGEAIPFQELIEQSFLSSLTDGKTSLTAGHENYNFPPQDGLILHPQICYESAFPNTIPTGKDRPNLIVISANDEISSGTSEPYQSLLQTRVRAIETGLPIARSANSGISAIITGRGQIIEQINVHKKGVISSDLPRAEQETLYSKYQDKPFLILSAIVFLLTTSLKLRRSQS